jgi:hypothetical protein
MTTRRAHGLSDTRSGEIRDGVLALIHPALVSSQMVYVCGSLAQVYLFDDSLAALDVHVGARVFQNLICEFLQVRRTEEKKKRGYSRRTRRWGFRLDDERSIRRRL